MRSLVERDLQHIWHPCSQMKDYEALKPLEIIGAYGSYLHLSNGKQVIDAISSWWCKALGHNHPRLKRALIQQVDKFEHVILANTTNETIVRLSEKLSQLTASLNKVFYASEGSCAVEIAMKMSLHSRVIQGDHQRNLFVALENGYHGETLGALSVSDVGMYRDPYSSVLFDTLFIPPPYVTSIDDDAGDYWENIEKTLERMSDNLTAIIVEPILQGAGGMKIYSPDLLKRLRAWTTHHNVHLIADEIMTGMGRTGKMLACEHADVVPDFVCLAKGLTSGWLPLSAVLTTQTVYDIFYDDFAAGKSFLHSHTQSGNALAASIALETLRIMEEENVCAKANQIGAVMKSHMLDIAQETGCLKNVRSVGAMVAADLVSETERGGFEVYKAAIELGALLRPLGNTLYWLPPLNVDEETLFNLKTITAAAICKTT